MPVSHVGPGSGCSANGPENTIKTAQVLGSLHPSGRPGRSARFLVETGPSREWNRRSKIFPSSLSSSLDKSAFQIKIFQNLKKKKENEKPKSIILCVSCSAEGIFHNHIFTHSPSIFALLASRQGIISYTMIWPSPQQEKMWQMPHPSKKDGVCVCLSLAHQGCISEQEHRYKQDKPSPNTASRTPWSLSAHPKLSGNITKTSTGQASQSVPEYLSAILLSLRWHSGMNNSH